MEKRVFWLVAAWHRMASQPFQADQTANYRDVGTSYLDVNTNAERFKPLYREAYLNGCHQAYLSSSLLRPSRVGCLQGVLRRSAD
jgi:hypothetical protein